MPRKTTPLQLLRLRANLDQAELGQRIGRSQATVSRIESGEYGVERYVEELAEALGVSEREVRRAARMF